MIQGIVNVLKPPGMTSHDVVAVIRKQFKMKRVGHAGTLDPAAAGVLPVYIGLATRFIEYAADFDKSYRVELTVGRETDTGDDMGKIIRLAECSLPEFSQLEQILLSFKGSSTQIPPMYSAVKIGGKKLYEYARDGIVVEREPRAITIYDILPLNQTKTSFLFDVTCSKGTYIRTLCADIGAKLNCPVVMSFLVRTRVGCFDLAHAKTLEEIAVEGERAILPIDSAIQFMPAIILNKMQAQSFLHGQFINISGPSGALVRFYDENNHFIGIARKMDGDIFYHPLKVLNDIDESNLK